MKSEALLRPSGPVWRVLIVALAMLTVAAFAADLVSQARAPKGAPPDADAAPQGESTLGDLVWRDEDRDGLPNPAEPGIDGVLVSLYQDDGDGLFEPGVDDAFVTRTVTGDNPSTLEIERGWYDFSIAVTNALYWVEVDASNFVPGGPLEGATLTSGSTFGESPMIVYLPGGVQDYNDADFGYYGAAVRTPTPTATASPTSTAGGSPTATATATRTATGTATGTPTSTATATKTPTASVTATRTATGTVTGTPTSTATATRTRTPTATDTGTRGYKVYVPLIVRPLEPTPTPTWTPTASRTPTATPTITRTPSVTPTPSITPTPTPLPTGIAHPKAVAVNPDTHRVYVTSRDNSRLFMLDGESLEEIGHADVGRQPWGVAVNAGTNKVYVASFGSNEVHVLDATTLALQRVIPVGSKPTFVDINRLTNRVFVVSYGNNSVTVINGETDQVETTVGTGGLAAWGLAVNPNLNRVYVGNRDSGDVTTLDGNNGYAVISWQTIKPCGGGGSAPYELDFNPQNDKLYVACSPFHEVNSAAILQAGTWGLNSLAFVSIGNGGDDGGGGVVVDGATGNAFFTNSAANSVSVIGGTSNRVVATIATGRDPFGIGADPSVGMVYVANRRSNDLTVIADTFAP